MDWSTAFSIMGVILVVGLALFGYKMWCWYRAIRQVRSMIANGASPENIQAIAAFVRQKYK